MENTEINKVKFFAQYWGQKVFVNPILDSRPVNNTYLFGYDEPEDIEMEYLELKPLSLITDEDAEGYLHFIGCHSFGNRIEKAKEQIQEDCHNDIHMSDYLRAKGYALPWMGISVEKLVEYGWIKLI